MLTSEGMFVQYVVIQYITVRLEVYRLTVTVDLGAALLSKCWSCSVKCQRLMRFSTLINKKHTPILF